MNKLKFIANIPGCKKVPNTAAINIENVNNRFKSANIVKHILHPIFALEDFVSLASDITPKLSSIDEAIAPFLLYSE